ncbi:adaptor-related protein complex 2, alpha subunit [Dictyostelium discoideum AX4]|uniref:AP-2 complex subunit alpha-2 n=1 Tax=Dictyostelium discoideum TaxID=44689 RepID=AP2A2_DICDI|nr:adaptor-related protein complex 2, alpha subunit [Dictyostelium discoideum AX4]Q86KI1.1 RecName: Full=AP-2 complex subunit alpha-2; AltName: Full=100 kDa coated vesicle protein C; AltName: Full=Adaptor protein complex AP-2 subunit alpha-2; AltName: Full=Adaptor-related protein complex 2 subunit alpha-2; AltName: Full=Alpha-adaptin C; AltName: Full=Alpha2-adaptin; AltName: Full=Clathrin assembly protein complex 2 alpha-C large chain; AltName: Full=Plasma membrane adaptor HA2/AP2 adaptin alpha C |eukprot:XP_644619.1 adaptor-related protein complex 2, alpha subunit [Dictyostelium discoideum AX4]
MSMNVTNPNIAKTSMRGLTNFISDLRNSPSKENEEKRVTKEMAHIRKEFKENKNIDGYQRRKYVCKLVYMYMLGYELDFGHMEAVTLLSSTKFSEKQIGYIALGILLNEQHEMLPLIINSFKEDLLARSDYFQSLALAAICNIGGKEVAEFLSPLIQKLLIANTSSPMVKKRCALAILRMNRKHIGLVTPDSWVERLVSVLDEPDFGVLTSLMSLLIELASENPIGWEPAIPKVIHLLKKIIINKEFPKEYVYYHVTCPWLQVKLLKFLRYFPAPDDSQGGKVLGEILTAVFAQSESAKAGTVNHKNSLNAVLFEAINLIIHLDNDPVLLKQTSLLLGRFITVKETNIRYLGLEAMSHFASLSNETSIMIKKYQDTVLLSLKDSDISIRRRALDLLYGMCDKNTCKHIVAELLSYLQTADYAIREELVIKIANLAEKFASNYSWYVDVILQLITTAGDFVSDDIWFRVVKIVTNHEDIQAYAASTVFNALQSRNCHETLIKVGGYILGEFGHLIADNPQSSPLVQFNILHSKFNTCGAPTKALLLSTYAKFVNLFPELTQQTQEVFKQHQSYIDAEIQQRACEYLNLTSLNEDLMQTVLDVIPAFIDAKDNSNTTSNTANNSNMINSQDSKISSGGFNQSPQPSQQQQQQQPPQQQQAQLQQNVSSNGLDLLDPFGLGLGNQQQQQQQPVQQAQPVYQQQQQAESFSPVQSDTVSSFGQQQQQQQGGFSSPTIQASSSPISSGGSDPMQIKILASYKRLCLVSEGVLYEDSMLQVGLKSEYQSGQGRLMLYYGNSSAFPLTNFNVTLNSIAGLTLQPQSIAPVIQPKAQLQQPVTFSCTSEFTESPVITINFLTPGKPITITLRLPIVISKFFEPLRLSSGDFFARWKTISGKPLEIQEIFKSTKPIDIQSYNRVIQEGLNITVLKQVDPNPNNIVASCLFPFGSNGQPINSYIRIETNPQANMCRLTIRSQSATLTNTIKNLLISHLQ